jgi:hypothetical protein
MTERQLSEGLETNEGPVEKSERTFLPDGDSVRTRLSWICKHWEDLRFD